MAIVQKFVIRTEQPGIQEYYFPRYWATDHLDDIPFAQTFDTYPDAEAQLTILLTQQTLDWGSIDKIYRNEL